MIVPQVLTGLAFVAFGALLEVIAWRAWRPILASPTGLAGSAWALTLLTAGGVLLVLFGLLWTLMGLNLNGRAWA